MTVSGSIFRAKLTVVASFAQHFFLENLAVRRDRSILVTVVAHGSMADDFYIDETPVSPM